MKNKIVIIVFLVYVFGMAIWQITESDRKFSDMENRVLSQAPEFSIQSLTDGEYTANVESYLADQMPMKDVFVQMKTQLERTLGRTKMNGIFLGKQQTYLQDYVEDEKSVRKNLMQITNWMKECPTPAYLFLIPNAISIWSDRLPEHAVAGDQTTMVEHTKAYVNQEMPQLHFVDATKALQEHKSEQIYYRTDHHWTMTGAYYGYVELMKAMNREAHELSYYSKKVLSRDFLGSLYSKAPMFGVKSDVIVNYDSPDAEICVQYENGETDDTYLKEEYLSRKDKYATYLGGNYGRIEILNEKAATKDSLVICKDSYSNCMLPFLADEFARIIVIDFRYYKEDLHAELTNSQPTELVFSYNVDFFTTDDHFTWLTLGQ